MHALGEYISAQRGLDGDLRITFAVDDEAEILEAVEKLKGKKLVLDIKKYNPKRSLNANAYFWKLCDLLARALGSDKDTVYLLELSKYGCYEFLEVIADALKYIEPLYRVIEVDHYYTKPMVDDAGQEYMAKFASVKCYIGSSQYDKKQMSDLINGTVNDAHDLGVETWTDEEISRLIGMWEARNE